MLQDILVVSLITLFTLSSYHMQVLSRHDAHFIVTTLSAHLHASWDHPCSQQFFPHYFTCSLFRQTHTGVLRVGRLGVLVSMPGFLPRVLPRRRPSEPPAATALWREYVASCCPLQVSPAKTRWRPWEEEEALLRTWGVGGARRRCWGGAPWHWGRQPNMAPSFLEG